MKNIYSVCTECWHLLHHHGGHVSVLLWQLRGPVLWVLLTHCSTHRSHRGIRAHFHWSRIISGVARTGKLADGTVWTRGQFLHPYIMYSSLAYLRI